MSDEELTAAQGGPDGEPVASPDTEASDTGAEATEIKTDDAEPSEPEATEEPEARPKAKEPPLVRRIHQQSAKIADLSRQNAALQQMLYAQQGGQPQPPMQQPAPGMPITPDHPAVQQALAQRQHQERIAGIVDKGRSEFPDFDDRSNLVASLGATQNPAFMQALAELEDGHKVVAQLADDPDEAERILSLHPMRMAIELAKLSAKAAAPKAPKPISKAPAPIKPVDGGNNRSSSDLSDDIPMSEWLKRREAQRKG